MPSSKTKSGGIGANTCRFRWMMVAEQLSAEVLYAACGAYPLARIVARIVVKSIGSSPYPASDAYLVARIVGIFL